MSEIKTAETIIWALGIVVFSVGCGFQWGWPAGVIAFGGIFAFWPLAKQFRKAQP